MRVSQTSGGMSVANAGGFARVILWSRAKSTRGFASRTNLLDATRAQGDDLGGQPDEGQDQGGVVNQ